MQCEPRATKPLKKTHGSTSGFSRPKSGIALTASQKRQITLGSIKYETAQDRMIVFGKRLRVIFLTLILGNIWASVGMTHPVDMDAIAQIESGNNPNAVGKSGEIGLYQISPIVLKHFQNVNPFPEKVFPLPGIFKDSGSLDNGDLKNGFVNKTIANWYMNWLFDRCWTVKDTLIAWNWGIGNWREWKTKGEMKSTYNRGIAKGSTRLDYFPGEDFLLPETTQAYLKKYEKITGEVLS